MAAEIRTFGKCRCGQAVTHIANSALRTCRADGCRYIYPDEPDAGWDIFRCRKCMKPIDKTFVASVAAES